VLVIEAIHQLFPWLRHLFADSVYNSNSASRPGGRVNDSSSS
jgi:hypothetical protein